MFFMNATLFKNELLSKFCVTCIPYCYTDMFELPRVQMKCLTVIPFHCQAQKCLKLLKSRKCFDLKILKSLSMELTIQKQNILYHLGEEWQKLIVWKFPPSKGDADLSELLCLICLSQFGFWMYSKYFILGEKKASFINLPILYWVLI